jgi:GNAT superfamily N-acetyltransferase
MSVVQLRAARQDDMAALQGVFLRASLSNAGDRAALLAHPEALRLRDDLASLGRTTVAELADGTVVGFASTCPTQDRVLELDDLFVDPDRMRKGVARLLVQHLEAEALAEGVTRLEVTANQHALGFYRAMRFVADGLVDTDFGPGLRMHLDIIGPDRDIG